jgi:DNA-binding CsgD family transcriptional regulator
VTRALPYGVVADALRAVPLESHEELAPALRRELAAVLPEAAPDDEPHEGTQAGLFGSSCACSSSSAATSHVLVLEDVHGADPSTRDMLKFLVSGLRQTAVLLVLTHRTERVYPRRALQLGMRDSGGAAFPDLTPREREVLALVAEGRTNRQIAQELVITDKTASVHVSNILGKLGASNRGEAAALAHRAGFDLAETAAGP